MSRGWRRATVDSKYPTVRLGDTRTYESPDSRGETTSSCSAVPPESARGRTIARRNSYEGSDESVKAAGRAEVCQVRHRDSGHTFPATFRYRDIRAPGIDTSHLQKFSVSLARRPIVVEKFGRLVTRSASRDRHPRSTFLHRALHLPQKKKKKSNAASRSMFARCLQIRLRARARA